MNEKEKMLAGELYDANHCKDLIEERCTAKDRCFEYNMIKPSKYEEKAAAIKNIFGKTGDSIIIEQPFMCDYGYNIVVFIRRDTLWMLIRETGDLNTQGL